MNIKKIMVAIVAITLLLVNMFDTGVTAQASGNRSIVFGEEKKDIIVVPGETHQVTLPIKALGGYIEAHKVTIEAGSDAPFIFTSPKLFIGDLQVAGVTQFNTTDVKFDVRVKESAKIGSYPITLRIESSNFSSEYEVTISTFIKINVEKAPAQLTINSLNQKDSIPGCDTELSFTIKNEGELIARNVFLNIGYGDSGFRNRYTATNVRVGDIVAGGEKKMTLPVSILPSASAGSKVLTVNFEYKDIDGVTISDSYDIFVTVGNTSVADAPRLEISSITYNGELRAGDEFVLIATVKNQGGSLAKNIAIQVDEESIGTDRFIKNYFTETIPVQNIKKNGKVDAKIPLIVSKEATSGLQKLVISVSYTDEYGVAYSTRSIIYPEIIASNIGKEDGNPNIIISSVSQNPSNPVAGGRLEVSFDIENKSPIDIKELKIYLDNLMGNTFIPVNSEPYIYIEELPGRSKKRVTIPLILSESIPEGLNNLSIKYSYAGGIGMEGITIPIRNIKNDKDQSGVSRPKLIISKYSADIEELRAGSVFNFLFDLHNTNATVAAKNITVTISQPENVFTVTQGSNSFFISKIGPGETVQNSLELKIKSDAMTRAYPIEILIDYEYDGAEPNPQTGEIGETKTEKLNLQVVENSRPVVDYVNVYSWDGGVTVFNPATLAFEFYNMGKSELNNVIVKVEGDFSKADGNMYFVGNVMAGGSSYIEFEVIPNVEGFAKGELIISFEDSNGDVVEMTKEFETMVQGEANWGGGGDWDFPHDDVFNPIGAQAKKAIMPIWAFILMQIGIIILFIPITRKVIISIYKMKLRKQEEASY